MNLKTLFVVNGFPSTEEPHLCQFTKIQYDSLKRFIEVDIISNFNRSKFFYFTIFFKLLFRKNEFQVIHLHHGLILLSIWPLLFIDKERHYVISFLNNIENEFEELSVIGNLFSFLCKLIIKWSDITVIEKNNRYNRSFKNYKVLPNGIFLDDYRVISRNKARKLLSLNQDDFYMLFVSSKKLNRKQKRFDIFLKIYNKLYAKNKKFKYITAVNLNHKELIMHYFAANVLVVTSDFEGSPNAVKESIACNTNVVTFDVGDVKSILNGIKNSFVVKNDKEMEHLLLNKMNDFLLEEDLRSYIIKNGYENSLISQKLIRIYKNE